MSDERRRQQYLRDAAELLKKHEAQAQAIPPELLRVVRMEPVARTAVLLCDMLRTQVTSAANQLGLIGGVRFVGALVQIEAQLAAFREQIMQREGPVLEVAQDVPEEKS